MSDMTLQYYPLMFIIIAPLAGFIFISLFSSRLKGLTAGYIASAAVLISFLLSISAFRKMILLPEQAGVLTQNLFVWMSAGNFSADFSLTMDNLSAIMALTVSGVSFLIHIYSLGYMAHDRDFSRFFSYLNLFVAFMLILVLASNPILMFVGWEGVGLCSYLLIGFWYENLDNSRAGKKAFLTNRVGDAFFIIGLLLLISHLSAKGPFTLDFAWLKQNYMILSDDRTLGLPVLTVISVLLFLGATGKSAQFPLYVWLPDAMAGPTPVSALIHAATMVTAGVYMVSRLFFLFSSAPYALEVILYTASFTSLLAALIACLQSDIKKILAYSTISQIGYMFLGAGAGVYSGGMFHLVTHAFFKALLFLAAGSVIHALSGVQDIFRMGGLRERIKYTFFLTLAGWLTISGMPPFSGFYSKDFIIETVWASGHIYIWAFSVITAGITAYYMTRMFKITFLGEPREKIHAHESPVVMLWPMTVLAILSVAAGALSKSFLEFAGPAEQAEHLPFLAAKAPLIAALIGLWAGFYLAGEKRFESIMPLLAPLQKLISNKFYLDEIYGALIIRPLAFISENFVFSFIDRKIIDGLAVEGLARSVFKSGEFSRKAQTGNISAYAVIFALAAAGSVLYALIRTQL